MPHFNRIVIHGVGLLGASIGLAVRQRGLARSVVGLGRNEQRLERAREMGCVDAWTLQPGEAVPEADLVILCTPVRHIIQTFHDLAPLVSPGAIITDVGSAKASIVAASRRCLPQDGARFIGSHPIAGGEKTGADNAYAALFQNACCVLTPTDINDAEDIKRLRHFWEALGMRITICSPEDHDRLLAAVSHMPHLAAAAITAAARAADLDGAVPKICGAGLRDTTRIAEGSPDIWLDICTENRPAILESLDTLIQHVQKIREALSANDEFALREILSQAAEYRAKL
ncbi:prephenate dehydrogenase/arogenate dehydrogenase family protein [Candidatus Sumerlaeota bacterium]|nr:prephenate dehydrogenase/arogenate dehydrogenase family protein [Candidatus Sumerlaeota bacterium]